jgi:hypothetical protein
MCACELTPELLRLIVILISAYARVAILVIFSLSFTKIFLDTVARFVLSKHLFLIVIVDSVEHEKRKNYAATKRTLSLSVTWLR